MNAPMSLPSSLLAQRVERDAVIQHEPAGLEQARDLAEVHRQILAPDVLEHADARDLVERRVLGHVAIVEQPHLAPVLEPELLDLRLRA